MMTDHLAFISVILSGISALVSATGTLVALYLSQTAVTMLKSKEGKIKPGPDEEEGISMHDPLDEAER